MSLPDSIKQAAERAAEAYVNAEICYGGLEYPLSGNTARECTRSYLAGWAACYTHLLTTAPEFGGPPLSDAASSEAVKFRGHPGVDAADHFYHGARWQFEQTAATVAALRAEKDRFISAANEREKLYAEEIDRLRTITEQMAGAAQIVVDTCGEERWDINTAPVEVLDNALATWRGFGGKK